MTAMRRFIWMCAAAAGCAVLACALPARAQDVSVDADEASEIVIEVDEEGRLTVNGEAVESDDGRVVVRLAPNVRADVLRRRGPAGMHRPEPPIVERFEDRFGPQVHVDHQRLRRLVDNVRIPDVAAIGPMMERFHFELEGDLEARMEEHREVAELERESRDLARDMRRAEGDERQELEAELRSKLDEIFEKKMEIRRQRVERLEERLEEERAGLSERADQKESLIDRRMQHLLGESDELEW